MASSHQDSKTRMTPALTREWLETKTFRLQPDGYQIAHPEWPGAVGLEIEMLPLFAQSSDQPKTVPLQGEKDCLAAWLREIAAKHKWVANETTDHGKKLLVNVLLDQDDNLSFEPGGQLEFSSKPYGCLTEAIKRTKSVQKILDEELRERGGVTLTQVGLNPWHSTDEIGLQMNKSRYVAMNDFFSRISEYGPRMMRQTCTVQVNLDFGRSETMMANRYLASLLIAPFSGAVFNYSGLSEKKSLGMTGFRSKIWRHMDPSRTGVPPMNHLEASRTKKACVDTYYQFLMNARVVFVTELDYRVMHEPITWSEWMERGIAGIYPTASDFETHLSLLFPEVRARGFLELRSVDCQSRVWQFVPAGWWIGLLYDEKTCGQVIDLLLPLAGRMTELLDAAPLGLTHPILGDYSKKLMKLAAEGLSRLPGCYFEEGALRDLNIFAEHFTMRGRVPAQDILDDFVQKGTLSVDGFKRVEDTWRGLKGV